MTSTPSNDHWDKVFNLLMEMHAAKEVYVSNGQMGAIVTDNTLKRCRSAASFSTETIRHFILTDQNLVKRD